MNWEMIELGSVMDVKHGYAFKGKFFADTGEYILLTPGNCNESGGLRLRGENEKYYNAEFPSQFLLNEGDLLVVMTDLINAAPILGGSFLIPDDNRFLHNQRLGRVVVTDESRIDKGFLYYVFNTRDYRAQVRGSASGATVRHTSPRRIRECKVRVPSDVACQRAIAETLFAYDTLIENNRCRIGLLEHAVRLLYQEWFVRFRFLGHEHTKTVNGLPKAWEQKCLGDICTEVRDVVSPSAVEPDTPYIGLEHMPRRSISLMEWNTADAATSAKHRYAAGDILFGRIRPYFHKVGIAFTNGLASSDAIVIRPNLPLWRSLVLMTVSSDKFVAETSQTMREGSKMPRADWKLMIRYPVALPPPAIMNEFSEVVTTITDQLRTLCFQTRNLQAARDLLLPRLMSGEIPV